MVYYCPLIFQDVRDYVQRCDSCQRMGHPGQSNEMLLQPQVVLEPFEKWAIYFIGPFNSYSHEKVDNLICTDYLKK